MEFLPSAFDALNLFRQFIVFVLQPSKNRPGKTDKFPIDHRTGQIANAHDPAIWADAQTAIASAKRFGVGYGVGFVLTENDPFWFLDIDDCLEPCGTKWSPLALHLLTAFNGAAVEVSSSARGLHVIGSGRPPPHSCRNSNLKLEFYTSGRFIALTGLQANGSASFQGDNILSWLIENFFPVSVTHEPTEWTNSPCDKWRGPSDDQDLISWALRSQSAKSIFSNGATFKDLWEKNIEVLARAYPDPDRSLGYNESSADAALAQHLAFWTGNDCERIRRLMYQSALVREKWNREDYLPRTIQGACGRQKEWLEVKQPEPIVSSHSNQGASPKPVLVSGNTFLTIDQQIEIFTGCIYIADENRILIPGGYTLNNERFKVMYGGYSMPMDNKNERVTRNAWEAFTESQAFRAPRVNSACFRPDLAPGSILEKDGQRLANIWWPVETPRLKGDITPFMNHMIKLFPDPTDRMIILCYIAAIVQHKGIKFQWCPLLQGVEGNGKTLITRCVAFAIGDRYTHYPKAAEIAGKFNDWLYAKIFIAVEDIYVPDARMEVMEIMKPMVTSERQEIEPKGGAKITRDICANFLINTNHKDGLRKTRSDRRFAPFYTPQQTVGDLKTDGMLGEYFPNLYEWLAKGGYAIVSEFLHTFEIPDIYNPATLCKRAPATTSTENAITHGLGGIEQEVLEAIEQGVPGFRGGWVSSMMLERLLEKLNATRRIPQNKRRDLLISLGYDWHPGLKDGRVNRNVSPDTAKPRLFIKNDHADKHIIGGSLIADAYEKAQRVVDCL